jgi:hypothetical protein
MLIEEGSYDGELGSISGVTDARKKTLRCPDMWAHAVSEEERKAWYRFGISLLGCGLASVLGRNGSPEPFSIFFLFFLLFYFCFPI